MKYFAVLRNISLRSLINLLMFIGLIVSTDVMASEDWFCNAETQELEVGKTYNLRLTVLGSDYDKIVTLKSIRVDHIEYNNPSPGSTTYTNPYYFSFTPTLAHVGSVVLKSEFYMFKVSHRLGSNFSCSKTLIVKPSNKPTISNFNLAPTVFAGNNVIISATGNDVDSDLTSVSIYEKLRVGSSTDYLIKKVCPTSATRSKTCSYSWTSSGLGAHTFAIRAKDSFNNLSTLSEKSITVKEQNTLPTVTLRLPSNSLTLNKGSSLSLAATPVDNDKETANQLKTLKFCYGNSQQSDCHSIPHSCSIISSKECTASVTLSASTYVWAEAGDNHGITKSVARKITIDKKPTVNFTLDQNHALISSAISFSVTPTDDVRVDSVQICRGALNTSCSNQIKQCNRGSGVTCKGSFLVDFPANTYDIFAVVTDNRGQKNLSAANSLVVYSGQGVQITSPKIGATFDEKSTITVTARTEAIAGLGNKLAKVDFYLDGVDLKATITKDCNDPASPLNNTVSVSLQIGRAPEHDLTAVATDCKTGISRHSAKIIIKTNEIAPEIPIVQAFTGESPSVTGVYTAKALPSAGVVTGYNWYENGSTTAIAKTVLPELLIEKGYTENGNYTYCAQAYNNSGVSPIGTGNQCKTITVARVEDTPDKPVFNNISLQQPGSYLLSWPADVAQAAYFELWGSTGTLYNPDWILLSGNPDTIVAQYQQNMPTVGNYSYQLKACNSQNVCTIGQQMTINHQAPYLQNAEFDAYYDSFCGANCLVLTGLALTDESIVSIQVRNSTESYSFSGADLISVDANTLKVKANQRIKDGLVNGGITIEVSNSVVNANSATIVLDNTGANERFDLINRAPTVSDNNTIYVGIDHNIYSLNPQNGETNAGWPYITNGDVVAAPTLSKNNDQEEIIYVGSKDHNFYALHENGELFWKTKTRGEIIASAEIDESNQLYVGSMDKALYAVDATTGDILWQYPLPLGISQKPALSGDGLVYVTTDDQQIHIINRRNVGTQALRWQDIDTSLIRESLDTIDNWQPSQGEVPQLKLITRLFYAILQRAPTERELTFFAYSSFMGLSLEEIVHAFLNADKGKENFPNSDSHSVFLDKLYAALFPDPDNVPALVAGNDKAYWLAKLNAGYTRAAIVVALVGSTEYGAYADNVVLVVLFNFYEECQLAHGCEFQGDSDGDGYSDAFEEEHGFNPLDPTDTDIAIPQVTATAPSLGQFTLNIVSEGEISHFKILQSVNDEEFSIIEDNLQSNSITLTKDVASYRYQVQACRSVLCSEPSNFVNVNISKSIVEGRISPDSAPQTVAPKNAPHQALIDASASYLLTSGNFRITENGTASFNLPIALPAGIAGVTPSLSLSYDSQRGESSAGVGWAVSAGSAVSRCRQTQIVDGQFAPLGFDENDRYCLDGQRLILVAHDNSSEPTEGTVGAHYRTEIDNGLKITVESAENGVDTVFKVKGLDGSIKTYGGTVNSTDVRYDGTVTWLIRTITDNLINTDNTVTYTYKHDEIGTNEIVLSRIDYSSNSIVLNYQAGRVRTSNYFNGGLVTTNAELTSIDVLNHNKVNIRNYTLVYKKNDISKRELKSITECSGTVCKQPIAFTYRPTLDTAPDMFPQSTTLFSGTNTLAASIVQDVNSDGNNDLVTLEHLGDTSYELCVDLGEETDCITFDRGNGNTQVPIVLTDTDNDGWVEILVMMENFDATDYLTDFWQEITFTDGVLNQPTDLARVNPGYIITQDHDHSLRSFDFDGDGHNDLVSAFEDKLKVNYWNASEQSYSMITVIDNFTGNISSKLEQKDMFKGGWHASDFNGDGRGDIIAWACEKTCTGDVQGDKVHILTSNDNGLDLYQTILVSGHSLTTADFNSDGYSDVMLYNTSLKQWQINLNMGKNYLYLGAFSPVNVLDLPSDMEFSADIAPVLTDLDSDGNVDILFYSDNAWYSAEWSPQDNNFIFNNQPIINTSSIKIGDSAYFTDWDNDGRQDFIIKRSKSVTAYMNVYAPTMPGLLDSVIQANGLNTSIQYGSMNEDSLYEKGNQAQLLDHLVRVRTLDIINSMPLVQSVTSVTPSTANPNATSTVQYQYKGAQIQLGGRGWLGFSEIITTSSKDGKTLTNNTKFKQRFPYSGMATYGRQTLSGLISPISENTSRYSTEIIDGLTAGTNYYRIYADDTRSCQANISRDISENLAVSGYHCNQILLKQNHYGDVKETLTSTYASISSSDFMALTDESYYQPISNTYNSENVLVALSDWLSQTDVTNDYIKPGRLSSTQVVHRREGHDDISRASAFTYYPIDHQNADMLWEEIVEPDGDCSAYLKTSHTYDTWGNEVEARVTNKTGCDNSINHVISTRYDIEGRYPTDVSNNSFTSKRVLSRNAFGQSTKTTNADGVEAEMLYGPFGSLVYTYNASGNQSTKLNQACALANCYMQVVSSKNGQALQTDYIDMAGRAFQKDIIDVLGGTHSSYQHYDSYGRGISVEAPGLLAVTKSFDVFDRLINEVDDNIGITTSIAIDGLSHTTTMTGDLPGGVQSTSVTLNSFGENSSVTDNLDTTLTYTYNSTGKLSTVHSSADDMIIVNNTYDILGRKIKMIDKNTGTWSYSYNALGQLVEQTDARLNITTNHYDNLGRKKWQSVTGEETSYWHYTNHQLTSESSGDWQRNYYYDHLGRNSASLTSLDSSHNCIDGVSYNSVNNELRITNSALSDPIESRCVIQQNSFDEHGRVYQKFDDYRRLSTGEFIEARGIKYQYAYGQVIKQQEAREGEVGRTYSETLSINNFGGISSYRKGLHTISLGSDISGRTSNISSGAGDYIQQNSYSYDGLGNLKTRTFTPQTIQEEQRFSYDGLNRITTVNSNQLYHYENNGNFQNKDGWTHSYGESAGSVVQPLHAVTSRVKNGVTERFFYDENGNQLSAEKNGVNWRNIEYSGRNKATSIDEDGEITQFAYDANNTRYKRTTANQVIYYVGALELTIQNETDSQPQQSFIKRAISGQALQTYYSSGNAQLKWLYKDILGSLIAVTNEQGELLKRFTYDAFGAQRELLPTELDRHHYAVSMEHLILAQVPMNIRGYTGHEPVGTNGRIIHMNGRIYDPTLGRFLQADPFIQAPMNSQSYNRYSYVLNNPLSYTDPSGYFFSGLKKKLKKWWKPIVAAVAVYFTAGAASGWVSTWGATWGTAATAATATTAATAATLTTAGSMAVGAMAGAAGGFVGGALTTGSFTGALKGALVGAFSGAAFGGVNGHYGDTWNMSRVGATSLAGGASSKVAGGNFANGAKFAFAAAMMRYGYNKAMNYDVTWNKGKGLASPDGTYLESGGVPNGPIVFGTNTSPLTGNTWGDFFKQGGALSTTANHLPGMNPLAKVHDWMQIGFDKISGSNDSMLRAVMNVPAMIPATVMTYGALMTDVQLATSINNSEWMRRNNG